MPAEVEPPELARLLDLAEHPRAGGWSLRAALVRYAQPEPRRVSTILDLVRRIEFALQPHAKGLEREGRRVWDAVLAEGTDPDADAFVVELLRASIPLDALGDTLAEWAVDISGERPDTTVDATTAEVGRRLDDLGVPRQQRERPPPGARQRG